MKFNKDQFQKIFLSSLLMIGLVYCYSNFLIAPLARRDRMNREAMTELDGNLDKARVEIKRSHAVQDQAKTAQETLAQIGDMIPEGAPVAWFPPRIHAFFERHNIKNAVVHSAGTENANPALGGFRDSKWTLDVPQAGAIPLGIAVAGLENEEKLLEISSLQITAISDSPEKQHVQMTLVTMLK